MRLLNLWDGDGRSKTGPFGTRASRIRLAYVEAKIAGGRRARAVGRIRATRPGPQAQRGGHLKPASSYSPFGGSCGGRAGSSRMKCAMEILRHENSQLLRCEKIWDG